MLQDVYTHCIDGWEDIIGQQIEGALDPDSGPVISSVLAS